MVRFDELAERYEMSRNTVGAHYRLLARQLFDIESRAQTFADEALRSNGMVASE